MYSRFIRTNHIVAIAKNGGIGLDGDLLYRISGDLKAFKEITEGHPVIMGNSTYKSIGRPLPNRTNIVVTRDETLRSDSSVNYRCCIDDALWTARHIARINGKSDIFIIGGARIYAETMRHVDRVYLTEINAEPCADVFYSFDRSQWRRSQPIRTFPATDNIPEAKMTLYFDKIYNK